VRIVGAINSRDVTDGGVSGRGHFRATGAITDRGKVVAYRKVTGVLPGGAFTLRLVTFGKKGMITYIVKINTFVGSAGRWTIKSATRAYKGLRGHGTERDNTDHTITTLIGTVSR